MTALRDVAAEYHGTPSARFAAFELANILYDSERYDEALEAFEEFLKKNPADVLAPAALEATGYCRESLGQWKEAIDVYEKLLQKHPVVAARVAYRLGLCLEKIGERDRAIESYEKTLELLPNTLWAEHSRERLDSLRPETPLPSEDVPLEVAPAEAAPASVE